MLELSCKKVTSCQLWRLHWHVEVQYNCYLQQPTQIVFYLFLERKFGEYFLFSVSLSLIFACIQSASNISSQGFDSLLLQHIAEWPRTKIYALRRLDHGFQSCVCHMDDNNSISVYHFFPRKLYKICTKTCLYLDRIIHSITWHEIGPSTQFCLKLVHRLRRWPNIKTALGQRHNGW